VFAAGLHLGVLMGFLVGGFLGQSLGWRAVFLIAGAAGLLMAGVAAWALKEPERTGVSSKVVPAKRVSTAEAVSTLWRSASMRHLFAGGTIANVATTALLAWLPAFLMRTHGLSLSRTGMLLAVIIGFLGACGTLLGGSLADRLGARDPAWRLRCIALVFLIVTPLWTVAIAAQSSALAMPALALAGALIGFHVGPSFAMVQTLARADMRALAASFLIFLTNLVGVAVGPLLIGSLSDAWLEKYGAYSLRAALLIVPPLFVWAAVHYEVAARTLAAELGNSDTAATAQQHATTPEAQVAALT
jgi:predicted MFS family arabinose efflux permease